MALNPKGALAAATALALVVGCKGSDTNAPPPQTPASETATTTSGNPPTSSWMNNASAASNTTGSGTNAPDNASVAATGSQGGGALGTSPSAGSISGEGAPMNGGMGGNGGTATAAGAGGGAPTVALGDSEIAAVTAAANSGEIEQAREVLKKSKNTRVRQFAQHMITDHTAASKEESDILKKAMISPTETTLSQSVRGDGAQALASIQSASASDLDRTYIDTQVKEHQSVLDALDNKLIPNARNEQLKKHLQGVRDKVAMHLKEAQSIQSSLK